jgi:hypothetical protein
MLSHTVPWLFAATPDATARVRLAGPLPPGTVVARQPGSDRYERHDPSGLEPARGIVYRALPDGWAVVVRRSATVLAALLNAGVGINYATRCDLQMAGIKVLP